jgi:hypothetical protein
MGSKELRQKEGVMLLLLVKKGKLLNLNSKWSSLGLMRKRFAGGKKEPLAALRRFLVGPTVNGCYR